MPFKVITPRTFTPAGVQAYAPQASGVYGITNAREWIYIGVAGDIRAALLAHLQDAGTAVMKRGPLGFVYELCDGPRQSARQDRLVLEYEPTCNRHQSRYA